MEKRWVQMDVAKGLGILVIVFGHGWFVASSPDLLYPLLAVFILPLFFFLSGVFFKPDLSFTQNLVRKADTLLKPFFITMLLYVVARNLLRDQPLLPDIGGVFYASVDTIPWQALWFLPHFWLTTVYAWIFLRLVQQLKLSQTTCCALVSLQLLLGILVLDRFWQVPITVGGSTWMLPGLPFSLEITPISSAFFLFGYLLRGQLRQHQSTILTLLLSTAIFTALYIHGRDTMDLAQRRYDHWFWTTALAVCGMYVCWALSGILMTLSRLGQSLNYIGQNTLILLIFHGEIQHKCFDLLQHLHLPAILAALIALVVATMVPLLIAQLIHHVTVLRWFYLPFPQKKRDDRITLFPQNPAKS